MASAGEAQGVMTRIENDPAANAVYQALCSLLGEIGAYEVEEKKTSLHITRGRAFLGVHPRKGGLLLNLVLRRPLQGPRVKKNDRVSANRYHVEVLLAAPGQVDSELHAWLREAYTATFD